MKTKKCRICKCKFTPSRPLQSVCGIECSIVDSRNKREKAERIAALESRKVIRLERARIKTRSEWLKDAQTVVNAYIRYRDRDLPCISCGKHHTGQYHAGHYRTVGAHPELRFEELNIHKQCSVCNNHRHGNIIEYRINLIKRIGLDKVEWLEGNHEPKKYSVEDIKEIITTYKNKLKAIKQ